MKRWKRRRARKLPVPKVPSELEDELFVLGQLILAGFIAGGILGLLCSL